LSARLHDAIKECSVNVHRICIVQTIAVRRIMQTAEEVKLFTSTFIMGGIANFLQFLVFYFLITTMALYATKEFSASETEAGFTASAIVLGAVFCRLVSGYIINRFAPPNCVVGSGTSTTQA